MADSKKQGDSFQGLSAFFRKQWAFLLWVIIFIGVLYIGLFGHTISQIQKMHFWHHWEVAALGASLLYNILFYVLGFFFPPRMFLHLKKLSYIGFITPLIMCAIGSLAGATLISLNGGKCSFQLLCILMATISFGLIDVIMVRQSKSQKVSDDFGQTFYLSELPAFIAFLILGIYSLTFRGHDADTTSAGSDSLLFRAFVGGAIAFQMIASNSVLAWIFRKPGEWYTDALDGE